MKKHLWPYLFLAVMLFTAVPAAAQETGRNVRALDIVTAQRDAALSKDFRTEFISYTMRENAEKGARAKDQHYTELKLEFTQPQDHLKLYSAGLDIPVLWLDREIFIHIESGVPYTLIVNGHAAGSTQDRPTPAEFNITRYITDGENNIILKIDDENLSPGTNGAAAPLAYVYSQPKIRVEDFLITAEPDSLNKYGILTIRLALANGYNFPEEINVGYDVYDPKGKLQYFDNRNVVVPGIFSGGRDTLEFREFIYGTPANLWTSDKPALYYGMLIVKHNRRITEYIPYRVGFGKTEVVDGKLVRNGKAVEVKAARYNAAADRKATADELARLKKAGINTLMVDRPQPYWLYDLTDEKGFYVFDQPDLNFSADFSKELTKGGTPANNPEALGMYIYHTRAMFARNRNHTSIAGWSLGDDHGNGYNLYKTYQWLKENEPLRPVLYNGAAGEWNTDMEPVPAVDAREILSAPAAQQNRRR